MITIRSVKKLMWRQLKFSVVCIHIKMSKKYDKVDHMLITCLNIILNQWYRWKVDGWRIRWNWYDWYCRFFFINVTCHIFCFANIIIGMIIGFLTFCTIFTWLRSIQSVIKIHVLFMKINWNQFASRWKFNTIRVQIFKI